MLTVLFMIATFLGDTIASPGRRSPRTAALWRSDFHAFSKMDLRARLIAALSRVGE